MKNKFLTIVAIILAFVAGVEISYIVINGKGFKKNGSEYSISYNSCSNCMSGTMVVENGGITQTVHKVYDSVVMVKNFQNGKVAGSGSGFVYKTDDDYGYIMTNQHVVDEAKKVTVKFTSGEEVEAEILGGDKFIDIAALRVPKKYVISVAKIGSTEELSVGDTIIAIGTPVGEEYYNTVSGGYVSGLDRKVTVSVDAQNDWIQDVLQVDAAINPGNSGGPLFNVNGEVIGVTSLKLINNSVEGMGFAIKIEDAVQHLDKIEKGERIDRPYLGITHVNATNTSIIEEYKVKIDSSIDEGIVILQVEEGSSAEEAGLQPGDVIIKIDDTKVATSAYLKYVLYKYNIGDTIEITFIRGKEEKTTKIELTRILEK